MLLKLLIVLAMLLAFVLGVVVTLKSQFGPIILVSTLLVSTAFQIDKEVNRNG